MKLIRKINQIYFISAFIILATGGIILFFSLQYVMNDEDYEKLYENQSRIIKQIDNGEKLPEFYPLIEVYETKENPSKSRKNDTIISELRISKKKIKVQKEEYHQLVVNQKIGEKTYKIITRSPVPESEDFLAFLFWIIFGLYFAFIIVSVFIINRLSFKIWIPFFHNIKKIKSFSIIDSKVPEFQQSEINEFKELNHELENLTRTVLSDYRNLKQFTENASHELQTPLAIIKSKFEALLEDSTLQKEHHEMIYSSYTSLLRLEKINKGLLLLTQIENRQYSNIEQISAKEIVNECYQQFKELIEIKNITVDLDLEEDFVLNIDKDLVYVLFNNLINNAIKHNIESGKIKIISKKSNIRFINSGSSKLANGDKIFERFYKEDSSSKSLGLGLALVRAICVQNNLKIEYYFDDKNSLHNFSLH